MKELLWPEVESSKPYRTAGVHVAARPSPQFPVRRVDEVPMGESRYPRPCIGPADQLPDGLIYWCLSCDRRVASGKQPFCRRHKRQREQYARDLRRARAKRVHVRRSDLAVVHAAAQRLAGLHLVSMNDTDPKARAAAHRDLAAAIEEFEHWAAHHLPSGTVAVRLRPLENHKHPNA